MNLKQLATRSIICDKLQFDFYRYIVRILFLIFFFTSSQAIAENTSIGVVNVNFLMENAPQSKNSSAKLKAKFFPLEQALAQQLDEINALVEKKNTEEILSSPVKKTQLEREIKTRRVIRSRALEDFREELRFSRDEALDKVQQEVYDAIAAVRVQRGIDIIIQEYISASKRVDITDDVLKYLQEKMKKNKKNRNSDQIKKGSDSGVIPR